MFIKIQINYKEKQKNILPELELLHDKSNFPTDTLIRKILEKIVLTIKIILN